MSHSVVAPSASARRVQCSMSTLAEAMFPDVDKLAAMEGEAAHWGLARMLKGETVGNGEIAPNGIALTEEMVDAAEVMAWDIERELRPFGITPAQGAIEQPVAIPRIHPQSWGTPDYRIWLRPPTLALTLLLYDFKFGHTYVEAVNNWQCIEYVAGVLAEAQGVPDEAIRVRVKIVQPRAYHRSGPIREWAFTASDIRAQINVASNAAHEALGPNAVARTGPECQHCKARAACPTFQRSAYRAVDEASREHPHELPPEALATELRIVREALQRLKARESGLSEMGLQMATKRGQRLPGFGVEYGQGRERWTKPAQSIITIGRMMGVDLAKAPQAITPKQAEAKGFRLDQFPDLVERPNGAAELVMDDGAAATRVFGKAVGA